MYFACAFMAADYKLLQQNKWFHVSVVCNVNVLSDTF